MGIRRKCFRNIPLVEKTTKSKFCECLNASIAHVTIENSRMFTGKSRRYMLAYQNLDTVDLTYDSIERFVKKVKTHRNIADQEKGYINNVWMNSIKQETR